MTDYNEIRPLLFGMDLDYPPLEYIDDNGIPQDWISSLPSC